jgi:hypothetical protein
MNSGLTRANHIEIANVECNDITLKFIILIRTMIHELYHSTGTLNIYPTIDESENLKVETFRHGAGFSNIGANAIEEGMADLTERRIFDEIKYLFPSEAMEKYNYVINKVLESYEEKGESDNIDDQSILITRLDDSVDYITTEYKWSKELAEYLSNEIYDFNFLLEDMRVNGNKLPLARAIESRFGRGYFKKIFELSANNYDPRFILEELKNMDSL